MKAAAGVLWWLLLGALVVLAPVPLGSVNTEWTMIVALGALGLGVWGAAVSPLLAGRRIRLPLVLAPAAFLVLWGGLHALRLPPGLVGALSPARPGLPPLRDADAPAALSVHPGATLERWVLWVGLFYLLWSLARTRSRGAFRVLAVAAAVHALLGLFLAQSGGTGSTRLLFSYPLGEVLTPFGTYVNKNHYAGLLLASGGGLLAVLGRRWAHALRRSRDLGPRARLSALTGRGFFRLLGPGLGALALLIALFASGSRGAAVAAVAASLAVLGTGAFLRRRFRPGVAVALVLLLAGAMTAATFLRSTSVLERLLPKGNYLNRPRLWAEVLSMSGDYPLTGTGPGTFGYIFPRYQGFEEDRHFSHAEGDWIQHLAETGIPGAVALAGFGLLLFRRVAGHLRADGNRRALAAGAGVGLLAVALHGFVDTSLHIPANLLAATVLAGGLLGLGRPAPRAGKKGEDTE